MGRVTAGVRGMKLDGGDDEVIGMICMAPEDNHTVMVVSENGYGKRSDIDGYRITNRGGKGVKTMNVTEKTGTLVAIKSVTDDNDLMIINRSGITLRIRMTDIRVMGRATQGVRIINLDKRGDEIASVCCVDTDPEEEAVEAIENPEVLDAPIDNSADEVEDELIDDEADEAPESTEDSSEE
jgi:DNA gyrase subunit A